MAMILHKFYTYFVKFPSCYYRFFRSGHWFHYFAVITTFFKMKNTSLNLKKNKTSSPKDALCLVWSKMAQWFWRRRFLIVLNVLLLFHNYLPFEKGVALHLNKLESSLPKDALCPVWLKMAQWFWRRRFFNFRYFVIIFPWKRAGPFI